MKKHLMSLAALMIAMTATVLTSCSNDIIDEIENPEVVSPETGTHVETLTIAFPEQTTTRVAIDGDHQLTGWEEGDEVTLVRTFYDVMYSEFGSEATFTVDGTYTFTCTNAANGTFTGTMPNGYTVNDCQLAFYNATGFETDGSNCLFFSPKTRASQNMKDVVMLVAKNDGEGNFEMKIFGSILQVTNNTGADITASVKYSWFGYSRYYDCNEIFYNGSDFGEFGTNVTADVNNQITLSKDAPTYVYIPVYDLDGGNAQYAVGLSAAGDAEDECSIVPFKTNPGNAKLFKKTLTVPTTGTTTRTGDIDVNWVQLWPGGPKFAEYNVGAANNKPEDYGYYYTWGGSQNMSSTDNCTLQQTLTGDNDTATKLWGSAWRMPTQAELNYLLNGPYCSSEWVSVNGVSGMRFTGKDDYSGNSVFFPAAGYCSSDQKLYMQTEACFYWSSSQSGTKGYYITLKNGYFDIDLDYRTCGYSVRPVLAE